MAPSAIYEPQALPQVQVFKNDILKVKNAPFVYRDDTVKKPVADDYMYAFKYNAPLPTHGNDTDVLDFTAEDESDAQSVADRFLKELALIIQSRDAKAFADLFLASGKFLESPNHLVECPI